MNCRPTLLMLLAFLPLSLSAAETMSLEQAINEATSRNPLVKVLEQQVESNRMDERSQLARMLPQVSASYGYLRIDEPATLRTEQAFLPTVIGDTDPLQPPDPLGGGTSFIDTASQRPVFAYIPAQDMALSTEDNYQLSVELTQTLPVLAGSALHQGWKVAQNATGVSRLDHAQGIRELTLQVIEAYYGVIRARQLREVAGSALSSVTAHLEVARAFFEEGMIPRNDMLTAEVRHAEAKQTLIQADNGVRLAEAAFNLTLARDLATPVFIDDEIPQPPLEYNLEEATDLSLVHREELKAFMLQLDSTRRGIKAARSQFLPGIAATCSYERSGENTDMDQDTWKAGVGLEWQLFAGSAHHWDLKRARALQSQTEFGLLDQKNRITLEVKNAYLSSQEARERTAVAAQAIDQAEENLRIEKDRYSLQVSTSTEVLDAQTLLDQTQNNYIAARADYVLAVAKLKAAMGLL